MKTKITAIVPAAGAGRRFERSTGKTFVNLGGVPLLIHTLRRLQSIELITEIIPVLREDEIEKGIEMIDTHEVKKIKRVVPGGDERQDSVYNAIRLLEKGDLILIHDGARPIFPIGLVERLVQAIRGVDGVVPAIPLKDTLKVVDDSDVVVSTANRERFRAIQTPQVFRFEIIRKAYEKAYVEGYRATDDAALVERIGGRVKVIAGSPFNIKITTPEDFEIVKFLIEKEDLINTGSNQGLA